MKQFRKILVATDLSDLSAAAFDYLHPFTKLYDAEVYLIHVIDVMPLYIIPQIDIASETMLRDTQTKVEEKIDEIVAEKVKPGTKVHVIVKRGVPHVEIIRFAREERIDLILLATHGRTSLAHMLIGSVAEKIVRLSTVPVLTVKPESMRRLTGEHGELHREHHQMN